MAVNIKSGNNGAGLANVSSTNELNVVTPQTEENAGFVQISSENDAGTITGVRYVTSPETSDDYRLRVGVDTTLFNVSFEGTTNSPNAHITSVVSGMTVGMAGGFYSTNTGNNTTNSTYSILRTWKTFPLFGSFPTYGEFWLKEVLPFQTNTVSDWGFGFVATNATPTDGVYFRRISSGELVAVLNNNGSEVVSQTIDTTNLKSRDGISPYSATKVNHFVISVGADEIEYWINDVLVSTISIPTSTIYGTQSSSLPMFVRTFNAAAGTVIAGKQVSVGMLNASLGDMHTSKPWPHVICGLGGGAYQIQPGTASGSTVTRGAGGLGWPTSNTARIAGTWTATSAPALASLGGLWTTPAISTILSDNDYPVFTYQNPAATTNVTGKTLYITGVRVGEAYVSAAASTNAIFLSYILAFGSSAAGTAGTDGATALATRGMCIGGHGFAATDTAGMYKPGFEVTFHSPLVIQPGQYFNFVVRPFGTVASNTLVVTSSLSVNGYFE